VKNPSPILLLVLLGCSSQVQEVHSSPTTEVSKDGQDQIFGSPAVPTEADSPASDAPEGWEAPVHLAGSTELEILVRAAFPEDPETAVRIVECESRWNPLAVSHTDDHGLFQINAIHLQPGGAGYGMDPYNPVENIAIARRLYDESGWHPWVCY
jgi:hypothetical protein